MKKRSIRKNLAFTLALAMIISLLPFGGIATAVAAPAVEINDYNDTAVTSAPLPATLDEGQVWTDKTVSAFDTSGNTFDVTLSALGRDTGTETASQQYDIVFVLDVSGSMGSGSNSKMEEMRNAANDAIESVLANNSSSFFNRVSVVTFGSGSTLVENWTNDADYQINSLNVPGGTQYTYIQSGLARAKEQLSAVRADATPVIILLTDGGPNRAYSNAFSGMTSSSSQTVSSSSSGGDNQSAAYTILYAAWLKTQISGLKVYTVGFDVASNGLAQAVLNPGVDGANITSGIRGYFTAGHFSTIGYTPTDAELNYTDGYFAADTSGLSDILQLVAGELASSSPITGDLTFTDTIGDGFELVLTGGKVAFTLDGAAKETGTESGGAYTYSADGVTVVFTAAQVTYTIAADKLSTLDYDTAGTSGAAPNTMTFSLALESGLDADTYYTNYNTDPTLSDCGCIVSFAPKAGNPYYTDISISDQVDVGTYTNIEGTEGYWGTPTTDNYSSFSFVYDRTGSFNVDSVTVNGITYNGSDTDTTISSSFDWNYYCYIISVVKEVSENQKTTITISNISWFDLSGGNNNTYTKIGGSSSDNDYDNNDTCSVAISNWVAGTPGVEAFTVSVNGSDIATVTAGGETYISPGSVDFDENDDEWSFSTAPNVVSETPSQRVTEVFTLTRDGDTLTITKVVTTMTWENGASDGVASQCLKATGFVTLVPSDGSLKISKTTNGGDATQAFDFSITLGDSEYTALKFDSPTDPDGETVDLSGGTFTLASGEYILITGLNAWTSTYERFRDRCRGRLHQDRFRQHNRHHCGGSGDGGCLYQHL